MCKEKRTRYLLLVVVVLEILITAWTLHGFAARSIENAMGTSKGDVAEQYATQLLLNEKILKKTGYGDIVMFRLIYTQISIV